MPNPVAYFELGGRHASELREFYRGLFGWNVEPFGQSAAGTDFFHVEPEARWYSGRNNPDQRRDAAQLRYVVRRCGRPEGDSG